MNRHLTIKSRNRNANEFVGKTFSHWNMEQAFDIYEQTPCNRIQFKKISFIKRGHMLLLSVIRTTQSKR